MFDFEKIKRIRQNVKRVFQPKTNFASQNRNAYKQRKSESSKGASGIDFGQFDALSTKECRLGLSNLRKGLSPRPHGNDCTNPLNIIDAQSDKVMASFLLESELGGSALLVRSSYGGGKTSCLDAVYRKALARKFAVSKIVINGEDVNLAKPQCIWEQIVKNITIPAQQFESVHSSERIGARAVIQLCVRFLANNNIDVPDDSPFLRAQKREEKLLELTGCPPLSWLLSDPQILEKDELIDLFSGMAHVDSASARLNHILAYKKAEIWPAFKFATQGDRASFLLSGLGRLFQAVGLKGLILLFDEAERWKNLNLAQQTRAGNLLGGLIWGATAPEGQRTRKHEPRSLIFRSRFCGGSDFTTKERNYVGLVIAMTPRPEDPPEEQWRQYGHLNEYDLPDWTKKTFGTFMAKLIPYYCKALEIEIDKSIDLEELIRTATVKWSKTGNWSPRSAITEAALAVLDEEFLKKKIK